MSHLHLCPMGPGMGRQELQSGRMLPACTSAPSTQPQPGDGLRDPQIGTRLLLFMVISVHPMSGILLHVVVHWKDGPRAVSRFGSVPVAK